MNELSKTSLIFIVNVKSAQGTQVLEFLNQKDQKVVCCNSKSNMLDIIETFLKNGFSKFVVCGGDGTVNSFVNAYMNLSKSQRAKVLLGVLPCGKANDLSRIIFGKSDFESAYNQLYAGKKHIKIDLIKVNDHYFITGGGVGLPTEVVQKTLVLSSENQKLNGILKDLMYYLVVIKKVFFGYSGVNDFNINNKNYNGNHMLIAIMNQEFIGKRFLLSPGAKNDDGLIDVCILPKINSLTDFKTVRLVTKGKHASVEDSIFLKEKRITLKVNDAVTFMADGEIIESNRTFEIKVMPKTITLFY